MPSLSRLGNAAWGQCRGDCEQRTWPALAAAEAAAAVLHLPEGRPGDRCVVSRLAPSPEPDDDIVADIGPARVNIVALRRTRIGTSTKAGKIH